MKNSLFVSAVAGVTFLSLLSGPVQSGPDPVSVSPMTFVPFMGAATEAQAESQVGQTASDASTQAIVDSLEAARAFCAALTEDQFTVDCLSERLETAALAMPQVGDYAQARTAILDASAKLRQIARDNRDTAKPRGTASRGGTVTSRPLVAVTRASLPSALAQAAAVLQETETLLLRSTSGTDRRRSHYTRIAAAVGSSKVLLRSL
ncbi:MAG: hypothetical protein Q7J57_03725 [Gemmobacter sp.]|nr:hypothetical protein [Gemmobacter sp.]